MDIGVVPGPAKLCQVFGVEYVSTSEVWLPEAGGSDVLTRNVLGVVAVLCQLRLLVAAGDECVATRMDGEPTTNALPFYVHPEAKVSIHGLIDAINLRIGGKQSSATDFVIPPAHEVTLSDIREAADLALREEEFEGLADLVEELRPRT